MSILIFIIILVALIVVHEFGHFIVAKKSGIRVDEFGIGFPPKIFGKKFGETEYTINWLPLGGFVKIFGENPDDESVSGPDASRSITHKPKYIQIAVLLAGVVFNIVFAWILLSGVFMAGMPMALNDANREQAKDISLTVVNVIEDSPASAAGLMVGDSITKLSAGDNTLISSVSSEVTDFVSQREGENVTLTVLRNEELVEIVATPTILPQAKQPILGFSMSEVGIVSFGPFRALYEAAIFTYNALIMITIGLLGFIGSAFTLQADLSQVAGPVGIVGLVGEAQALGVISLLTFTAFISLNLAIINILPFPALDGGRILFVIIESIKGSPIKPVVANTVNAIGFILLILLMVVVTYGDILRLAS